MITYKLLASKDWSIGNQELRKRHKGTCQWSCLDKELEFGFRNIWILVNRTTTSWKKTLEFYFIYHISKTPIPFLFLVKALVNLLIKVNYQFYSTQSESLFGVSRKPVRVNYEWYPLCGFWNFISIFNSDIVPAWPDK